MINIKFSNLANSTLVTPVTSADTTISIREEDVSKFPQLSGTDPYFMLCITGAGGDFEIVKAVGIEDNVITVIRAQEGTSVKEFLVGAPVEHRITAGSMHSIIENASETVPHADVNSELIGQGSETLFGHVKITDDSTSEATSALGIGVSPYAVKAAFDKILGASTETILTSSGSFKVPVTGTYSITVIGGGGTGGTGGRGAYRDSVVTGGGGGGGGGAGQVITKSVSLTKDEGIAYIIGGASGNTAFGSYATALGGGNGGYGSPGYAVNGDSNYHGGAGGGAGTSYGTSASAGTAGGVLITNPDGWAPVGHGGSGGISIEGTYGNGGRGGNGGSSYIRWPNTNVGPNYAYNGDAGTPGTQGCIKIRLAVG